MFTPVRLVPLVAFVVATTLVGARAAHAQAPVPAGYTAPSASLVIGGNSPRTELVTIRRVDIQDGLARENDIACVLPCTIPLTPGRYDVISVDAGLREQHRQIDVRSPNTRVDVDFRAHSDAAMLGAGVGFLSFGAILVAGGLVMGVGGLVAQGTANQSSADLMASCSSRFSDPTAIAACCLNLTGTTTNPSATGPNTGSQTARNQCVPTNYAPSVAAGAIAFGIGVVGVIVGGVLMARSAHRSPRDSQIAARRRSPIDLAFDTLVLPDGGGFSATIRF
jgi:hypothetical protein